MKITKGKTVAFLSLAALVIVGIGVWCWFAEGHPDVSKEAYDRIQMGMTLEEVEEIIGAKAGDYRSSTFVRINRNDGDVEFDLKRTHSTGFNRRGDRTRWQTDEVGIALMVDGNGIVFGKHRITYTGRYEWRRLLPECLWGWLP
jgi:hypothetical protein